MIEKRKKFYIPTSIVYANSIPHIGFALELVQADVLARYHRLLNEEVFFLTGTDEHGQKVAQASKRAGKSPEKFTEEIARKTKELTECLNISNDDFIRTTDRKRHWPTVEKVWSKLKENGDICKKKYKGWYCVGGEAFLKEKDLVEGKCPLHQREPEAVEEENYFFRLSKYQDQIKEILKKDEIKVIPETRKNEILNFIEQGVEDISCSRVREKLQWGIPVPGDKTQTIYVWMEALINYLSALDYAKDSKKFKKFWPPDVHCIGKDIFRFHSLLWPAILLSLSLELPKKIFVHGFITSGGQKMSKSLGNVVDPFKLVKKYGTDAVRYFLLREIPPTEDGDFTEEKFQQRYNGDLASGLGNLVARVLTLAQNSKLKTQKSKIQIKIQKEIDKTWEDYKIALENFKFNEALSSIWQLISFCDRYIEKERPWEIKSQNSKAKSQKVIYNLLIALANIAQMLQPFLPETSEKIFKQLGIKPSKDLRSKIQDLRFKIKKEKPLFPRI